MTTATAPKKDSATPLAELEILEAKFAEAKAAARELSRGAYAKRTRAQELNDQRRRLIHRTPDLVTHAGNPLEASNPVGDVDRELDKLGDLADQAAKVDHAERLARQAEDEVREHIAANFPAIVEALQPEAEAIVRDVTAATSQASEALGLYQAFAGRMAALCGPPSGIDGRAVPSTDHVGVLRQELERVALPLPLPRINQ